MLRKSTCGHCCTLSDNQDSIFYSQNYIQIMKTKTFFRFFLLGVMTLFTLGAWAQPDKDYLCFTATGASSVTLNKVSNPTEVALETSKDGTSWSDYTIGTAIELADGDKVYFRNKSKTPATSFSTENYSKGSHYKFAMTGSIAASGNVMSLIDQNCSITDISAESYKSCFFELFKDCTSLTAAPKLPATKLVRSCYYYMFSGCTGLKTAPELPAMTLASSCYSDMFSGCTELVTAPELPATTLAENCYTKLFKDCTKLNYVKVGFTAWYNEVIGNMDWLRNAGKQATDKVFVYPASLEIQRRNDGHVPSGWTMSAILNDHEAYTKRASVTDFETANVTYKRSFAKEGEYEALYLPFSVTMTSDLLEKVTIAKIYMVSTKGSVVGGAQDAGVDVVVVKALEEGESTKPHTPYFIRSKAGTDLEFVQEGTDIYPAERLKNMQVIGAQPGHITCATTMDSYDFIGSYTGETLNQEDGKSIYVLQNGGLNKVTAETPLPCNRWKMVKTPTEWNDNYIAPSAKAKMQIITLGEDETTGIIGLDARMNADSTNDAIYTPAGVAVHKQQLTPGLYIQHGKKFIVK